MRFIAMTANGDPSVLSVQSTDAPVPKDNQVLIEVAYAGVNRPDIFQRQGSYPVPAGASPILGLEVSGVVREIGASVKGIGLGDRVCALTNGGGYAEQVCVEATQCLPIPSGMSLALAAALPEACFTVWYNVFDRGRLQPDECLLVHGGASGIGTTAIQMAKALGSRVVVTASSDEKCQACLELGADAAINYQREDFVTRVPELNHGRGPDVILDMVGGDYIERNIAVAALDARIVSIAFLRGARVSLNFMPVMLKRLTLTGSTLRPLTGEVKATIAGQLQEHIWPILSAGKMTPLVTAQYPMEDVAKAHTLMESHDLIGKIILKIQQNSEKNE